MKKKLQYLALVILGMIAIRQTFAQSGINTMTVHPSAALQAVSRTGWNQGILHPSVDLATATPATFPSPGPANGLLVHNTNASYGLGIGIYQNIGTETVPIWMKQITKNDAWTLYGNRITSAGTPVTYGVSKIPSGNWLGTANATDLTFGTDSTEWMRLTSGGSLGIGTYSTYGRVTIVGPPTAALTLQQYSGSLNTSNDLIFRRSTGAFNVNTAVPQGTTLGQINFQGYTGAINGYVTGARIRSGADSTVSTTAMPGNLTFWTTPIGSMTIFERMRIRNDGRVSIGISTPDPTDLFTVVSSSSFPYAINGYNAQASGSGLYASNTNTANTFSALDGDHNGTAGSGVLGSYVGTFSGPDVSGVTGQYTGSGTGVKIGVKGYSGGTGNQNIGVYGTYNGVSYWGLGLVGIAAGGGIPTGNNDIAVVGWRANNSNYSGYFNGNHVIVNGTKSASVGTSKGNQLLYVTETPGVWFEDIGSAQLVNGKAVVNLDPLFLETVFIDSDHPMQVFVQEQGECNDLYVIPGTTSFEVIEKQGGISNIRFSYRIMAKRLHFQDHRFGCDPVWGSGDTRKYSQYATPPPVDYDANVKFQEEQKRNWKPTPMPDGFSYEFGTSQKTKSQIIKDDGSSNSTDNKKGLKFKKRNK